jgi:hypothetical protein
VSSTDRWSLPLAARMRAEAAFARIEWLRRRRFRRELALLDRFLAEREIRNPADVERARRQRCMATAVRRLRGRYMQLPVARQTPWLHVAPGTDGVLRSAALLVGSHFGAGLLTPCALARFGREITALIRKPAPGTPPMRGVRALDVGDAGSVEAAVEGLATLRRGGVVFIAGDLATGQADRDIEIAVLGRPRRISRGFAALAIAAGVAPTPVLSRVDERGIVCTWTEPPLSSAARDHATRIRELADGYGRVLSAAFADHPGNVPPPSMRLYLDAAPTPAESAAAPAAAASHRHRRRG